MTLRGGLTAAVALLLGLAVVVVANADHSWNGYRWGRTSNPFTLKLGDNLTMSATTNWDAILGDLGITNSVAGGLHPLYWIPTLFLGALRVESADR